MAKKKGIKTSDAIELFEKGFAIFEIERMLGCHTISYHLKKAGIYDKKEIKSRGYLKKTYFSRKGNTSYSRS